MTRAAVALALLIALSLGAASGFGAVPISLVVDGEKVASDVPVRVMTVAGLFVFHSQA